MPLDDHLIKLNTKFQMPDFGVVVVTDSFFSTNSVRYCYEITDESGEKYLVTGRQLRESGVIKIGEGI
jgi:hypothetical protein